MKWIFFSFEKKYEKDNNGWRKKEKVFKTSMQDSNAFSIKNSIITQVLSYQMKWLDDNGNGLSLWIPR